MMLGTNWVAKTEGATVGELLLAPQTDEVPPGLSLVLDGIPAKSRIGLELTGAPLRAYDYDRIRQAAIDYHNGIQY